VKRCTGLFVVLSCFFTLFLSSTETYSQSFVPLASFTADPVSGAADAPVAVQFTDTSTGEPTSWLWDFGDGSTSTDQNPMVAYYLPGTYPVTLTVSNDAGQDTITEDYIIGACPNPYPVMLESDGSSYDFVMDAYDAALLSGSSDITIMLMAGTLPEEELYFDADASVILRGGYDCSFLNDYMLTSIPGSLTIAADASGSLTVSNIGITSTPQPAAEVCDGLDNNGNGLIDEGLSFDSDNDGFTSIGSCQGSADDCNDNNASVHPGATDIVGDGIDQDCDGLALASSKDALCVSCHDDAVWNHWVRAPDTTCVNCHAATVDNALFGHYGLTVRTAGNYMTAGEIIICSSCHSDVFAKVEAVGLGSETCDTCHESRVALHATGTAHNNRLIDSSCGQCHTSDTTHLGQPGIGTLATAVDVDTLHRSNCTLCHGYAGTKLDPSVVEEAIQDGLNGAQITCTNCHTVHHSGNKVSYNAEADTSYTSQQGCAECHHDFDKVNGTSLGLTTWDAILVEHDLDGFKDGSTNTCENCHAYDGSGSPPLSAVQNAIASNNPATCATCHTDKVPDADHGVPTSGKHTVHLFMTGASCSTCHDTENFPFFKSGTDLDGDNLYNLAETDVCTSCHTDGVGGDPNRTDYKTSETWADPTSNFTCADCHGNPPNTGAHWKHSGIAASVYGSDNNDSLPGAYGFSCGNCHPFDQAKHADGVPDIELFNVSAAGFKLNNPSTASRTGTGDSTVCDNVYCHSDGRTASARTYKSTPPWGSSFPDNRCAGCHDDPPMYENGGPGSASANSHLAHIGAVGIHINDIYAGDFQGGLLPNSGPPNGGAAHGDPDTSTTISCNICHAATTDWTDSSQFSTQSGSDPLLGCGQCHNGSYAFQNPSGVITDKSMHINGRSDLVFKDGTFNIKAQLKNNTFDAYYKSAGFMTRNSYKADEGSHDTVVDFRAVSQYVPENKSCAVICHWETIPWGDTNVGCSSCHMEL